MDCFLSFWRIKSTQWNTESREPAQGLCLSEVQTFVFWIESRLTWAFYQWQEYWLSGSRGSNRAMVALHERFSQTDWGFFLKGQNKLDPNRWNKVSKVTHNSLEVKEGMEVRFPKCCDSARSTCTHCSDPASPSSPPKLIRTSCQKKWVLQWVWIGTTVTGNFDVSFGNTGIYSPCPVSALSRAGRENLVQPQLSHSQDWGSWFTCHFWFVWLVGMFLTVEIVLYLNS